MRRTPATLTQLILINLGRKMRRGNQNCSNTCKVKVKNEECYGTIIFPNKFFMFRRNSSPFSKMLNWKLILAGLRATRISTETTTGSMSSLSGGSLTMDTQVQSKTLTQTSAILLFCKAVCYNRTSHPIIKSTLSSLSFVNIFFSFNVQQRSPVKQQHADNWWHREPEWTCLCLDASNSLIYVWMQKPKEPKKIRPCRTTSS